MRGICQTFKSNVLRNKQVTPVIEDHGKSNEVGGNVSFQKVERHC